MQEDKLFNILNQNYSDYKHHNTLIFLAIVTILALSWRPR
jgi:hypothetical protein